MNAIDFPRDTWKQHHYPRLRGATEGKDGEWTVHLSLGLPCCGLDLLIEHPPEMKATDLDRIAAKFARMTQEVKTECEAFSVCKIEKATNLPDRVNWETTGKHHAVQS
jgi:hypothetical protein